MTRKSIHKPSKNEHAAVAHENASFNNESNTAFQFKDNRAETVVQQKLKNSLESTTIQKKQNNITSNKSQPIQAMKFQRFSGRFSNWGWYNVDEETLLEREKTLNEMLTPMLGDREYGEEVQELHDELQVIKQATYHQREYDGVKESLRVLLQKADAISAKIARREFIIDELIKDFNSKPGAKLAAAPLIHNVLQFAQHPALKKLGTIRNYLDMLTQFVSDAAMKSREGAHIEGVKAPILKAAVHIQKAYLYATVQKNLKKAETEMLLGSFAIKSINPMQLGALAEEGTHLGAIPKQREDGHRIDTGSMMVARAAAKSGVSPDLVVGLPTGGAHAASRFAAATGVLTGNTPEMWLTRPQGVKESSKAFMKGSSEKDILKKEELHLLVQKLRPKFKKAKAMGKERLDVFIIDDGQSSGRTLQMSKVLYKKALESAGIPVRIFTGLALGGNRDEAPKLYSEYAEPTPNHADFVTNNSADRSGPRALLERVPPEQMMGATSSEHGTRALDVQVTIVFSEAEEPEALRIKDLLSPEVTVAL